jgi:hypothetical protein
VPVREKTASAQSAIAQLEMCDLFFMTRTLIHPKRGDNRSGVTSLLLALRRQLWASEFADVRVDLTSHFTREKHLFLDQRVAFVGSNRRVTFVGVGLP